MYIPKHFEAPSVEVVETLLSQNTACDLITFWGGEFFFTTLPFIYRGGCGRLGTDSSSSLVGHVARRNPHWSDGKSGNALVIARGPGFYVSPSYYPSKSRHGRVVPTWDYVAVLIHGKLTIHEDKDWLKSVVTELTDRFESDFMQPWSVDDAPEAFIESQLNAIVGIEVEIEKIEAKYKLSQNRDEEDFLGVLAGVEKAGNAEAVDVLREVQRFME